MKKQRLLKIRIDNEILKETLMFLIRLMILSAPLYLIIFLNIDLAFMKQAVTTETVFLLKILGFDAEHYGFRIAVNGSDETFYFMIGNDCTGWKSMLFFFALLFAFPKIRMKRRFYGVLVGFPVLWFVNLLRIILVVLVERNYGFSVAMMVHDYVWRYALVFTVLSLWTLWLRWNGFHFLTKKGKNKHGT